jgi:tetratricopeptide (TPR) repeat protein
VTRHARTLLLFCIATLAVAIPTRAQGVGDAARLEQAGDYGGAARVLAAVVAADPSDATSWEALARNRYWAGDARGAREAYEAGLALHPEHLPLRLGHARLLVDLQDGPAARRALRPLRTHPEAAAEAERLLGNLAYWRGDLDRAGRHFLHALAHDPSHAEARGRWEEIRALSRPWLRLNGGGLTDTQPVRGAHAEAEAGVFLSPLHTVSVSAGDRRFEAADSARGFQSARLAYRAYWPAIRLDTELAAGPLWRAGSAADWTGRAALGLRLPGHVTATLAAERSAYLYTEASLFEPVTTTTASGRLGWAPTTGWLGEAGLARIAFPDANAQSNAYAWALAPLAAGAWGAVQAGYAFSYQHADSTRFGVVLTASPRPNQPARFEGRYAPYYTPDRLSAHSLTWAARAEPHRHVTLRAGGSYGVFASEQAPFVTTLRPGGPPLVGTYDNQFHPWEARASLEARGLGPVTASAEVRHARTAFYDVTSAVVTLLYRSR